MNTTQMNNTAINPMEELLNLYMNMEDIEAKLAADIVPEAKPAPKAGRRRTALESDKRAYHIGEKRKEIASIYLKPVVIENTHSGAWRNGSVSMKAYRPERHVGRDKRYNASVAAELREAKFQELEQETA